MKYCRRITCFLCLLANLFTLPSLANELVIGTTFSEDATQYLIRVWEEQAPNNSIRTLNRTSTSLKQLFSSNKSEDVDLILSSSPMLFYYLLQQGQLSDMPLNIEEVTAFVPDILKRTTIAFSISGYGILANSEMLERRQAVIPQNWYDLSEPSLHGLVIMSSPSRSDTNHIMLEALLQREGWDNGWAIINQIAANIATISSRSFGVADKIQANLGAAGITIDNYANLLTQNEHEQDNKLVFHYFENFPVSPTFIAITEKSHHKEKALEFIKFLLSEKGQQALSNGKTGKYPILLLHKNDFFTEKQQFLLSQPQIDYLLALKRETLVKLLFEHQIVYRLNQLQDNWALLYQKEQEIGHELPELRSLLKQTPVSELQSLDDNFLVNGNLNNELLRWQKFYVEQQAILVKRLENL